MRSLSPAAWLRILVPIAAAVLILSVACGGDDDNGNGDGNGATATATATPTDAPTDGLDPQPDSPQDVEAQVTEAADGVVETTMEDNRFTRNNLKVPLNETTTIQLVNDGAAVHNLRIAGPDGEWSTDDDTVSDPELLQAGETAVVEFTPTIAGTYTFRCDFHPLEMGGVIVVE